MLKVSVIIPTYKPQNYLWECLDSLYSQTISKDRYEIIIVLNGCNEPYATQIRQYVAAHEDMNVLFYQTDEPGVSNARNIALDMIRGEYVTFIDDDDKVSSSFLESLVLKAEKDTVALSNSIAFVDNGPEIQDYRIGREYKKKSNRGKQRFWIPKKYYSGPWMKLIHRDVIGNRRFDKRFKNGEDSLFMFLVSDKMKWCNFTSPESVYYRRIREGSALTSNKSISYKISNAIKLFFSYSAVFFKGFPRYNFWFYLTRVFGLVKSIL